LVYLSPFWYLASRKIWQPCCIQRDTFGEREGSFFHFRAIDLSVRGFVFLHSAYDCPTIFYLSSVPVWPEQVCQFFLGTKYQNGGEYTKFPKNVCKLSNGHNRWLLSSGLPKLILTFLCSNNDDRRFYIFTVHTKWSCQTISFQQNFINILWRETVVGTKLKTFYAAIYH
jgi:hypothetical protein